MGLASLRQLVFAYTVLAIYHAGYCCSVPRGWRTKGVSMRSVHADIVIIGKVVYSPFRRPRTRQPHTSKFPGPIGPYDAQFRVICALKGQPRAEYVNVSGFGYIPGHCVDSRALQNETYFTFLRERGGRYFVAEINSQVGTIPFRNSILRKVMRRLGRNGQLNQSQKSCAAFFRTKRKSAKKSGKKLKDTFIYGDSAFEEKSDFTETQRPASGLFASDVGALGFKSNWLAVILVGIQCVGWLLT